MGIEELKPLARSALPRLKDSIGAYCPGVADVDNDGDLDLVLGQMSGDQAKFLYYEQQNGTFKLEVAENPFADIHIPDKGLLRFQLADWDGDGVVDLVASSGPSLHYFKQGQCFPSSSACDSSATCNKTTSKCVCSTGSRSPECRICSDYHTRKDSMCRSCPGFGHASGAAPHRIHSDPTDSMVTLPPNQSKEITIVTRVPSANASIIRLCVDVKLDKYISSVGWFV